MIPESQWDSKKLKIFCLMRKEIKYKESYGKIKVHSINRKIEKTEIKNFRMNLRIQEPQ